ncbi:MAG: type IV pilus secretin PilQ [Desulfococcaceae bacterium]
MKCNCAGTSRYGVIPISLTVFMMLAVICAWVSPGRADDVLGKYIENVKITDHPQSIDILIQGNQTLTYTSVRQISPMGLILYFSKTRLNATETFFTPPNPVLQSVSASQIVDTSKIEIYLKKDAFYEIRREGSGMRVSFSKTATMPAASPSPEPLPSYTAESAPVSVSSPAPAFTAEPVSRAVSGVNQLQSVYAAKFGDSLKVFVGASSMITNYRSFIIDSPPRIVFDIFNIQSPYSGEKVIPVNTKWVSQIRYYNYSDRVRVILETQAAYLSGFQGIPVENGLLIQMGEGIVAAPNDRQPAPAETVDAGSVSGAVRLQSVYATQLDKGMLVTVRGSGPISSYKTSVTNEPPRIIVDMSGVESPYEGENSFPVDTQWVKNVRHQRTADGVQLTIETREPWLSAFSAHPDKNGLVVHIGTGQGIADTGMRFTASSPPPQPRTSATVPVDSSKPAKVEKIDFLSMDAGKSLLVVGTDRPVQYEVMESGDRKLELKLFNTGLPDRHVRPLITDRFESAVDQINPVRKADMKNTALFAIQLRESVPYFVEQEGGNLKIHFEASSISPKPVTSIPTIAVSPAPPASSAPAAAALPPAASVSATPPVSDGTAALSPDAGLKTPDPTSAPTEGMTDADTGFSVDEVPEYTGEKIALDFYETDIKNVFRILREISGRNFAVDKDVTGKVTLTLAEPVPWDQVLDLILKMNQLGKTAEGNIIRIATRKTLDDEEKMRQDKRTAELTLRDQQKQMEPLITEYIPVNYSKAKAEIAPHIEKILTKDRGSVSVDDRTNMIILTDTADRIKQGKDLIRKLDRVTPQVIIEARIVEASESFSRKVGTQWEMAIGVQSVGTTDEEADGDVAAGVTGLTDEVAEMIAERVGVGRQKGYNELGGTYGFNTAMNFPVAADDYGSFGFNFVRVAGTPLLLNAKLQAMESQGEGKIVSAPKIVTLDNKKAVIRQGVAWPYQTVEDGEVSLNFKDVDLLLEVTPHVTPDNRIAMTINITKNDIGDMIEGQQSFNTKEAQTELLVNDGDTVVIGGIIKTTQTDSTTGIPGLAKIPILGWLFKKAEKTERKEELLIFITPRIVQLEQRTAQF